MKSSPRFAVFCGSSEGNDPIYMECARQFAQAMIDRKIGLVYGGGNLGLMGAVAQTVHGAGLPVTGVIPSLLHTPKICNATVHDDLIVVPDMHRRKEKMYALADGFVALPGGIGTYEEILEIYTWQQLRYHSKPVAIFNPNGFYDGLLQFLSHAGSAGFIRPVVLDSLLVDDDPERLVQRMLTQEVSLPNKIV